MNWHKSLIAELAARRCIIFLGAGASASCISSVGSKHPPKWGEFLNMLTDLMQDKHDIPVAKDYMVKEKYLEAAEIIKKSIPQADFTKFIRDEFVSPRYKQSVIHEAVLELDPKVVITTNYDEIYDNYCRFGGGANGYNISKYYESHLISDLKSPIRLIVKAHGCVSDISKIVLTKSEYFKARQENLNFYKVLDALFLTHTIMFIGYSLNDPDIQLVLENVNITAPNTHPHYFITENNLNESIKQASRKAYNIDFIEFSTGNYTELELGIGNLVNEVSLVRVSNPSI